MTPLDQMLIVAATLLVVGVLASKVSDRFGVPALLLFLLIGMLAGSEGIGGIPFDDAGLTQILGIIALSFILFSGGLETDWAQVSGVLWRGLSLSTIGVMVTAVVAGSAATLLLGVSWVEGLLLGSIMSSTDAAAVFSVLRSRGASFKGTNKPLLELESGSNDPMAFFLTMALIRFVNQPDSSVLDLALMFVVQMVVGAAIGYGMGKLSVIVLNRLKLETEGLYPVLTLSVVLLAYGLASSFRGNGFLAVYLAGIVMGNSDFIHKRSLVRFHDGLAWLMQITMFVALGMLVYPSRLVPIAGIGLLIAAVLMFVARPAGVFISLAFARMGLRHKLLVSWVGLRGAVPIVLATFPLVAGVPNPDVYFNVVFFVVLTSVLLQGTAIPQVAGWLHLSSPLARKREYPLEYVAQGKSRNDLVEVPIPDGSPVVGRQIVDLKLSKSALIVLIGRNDDFVVPRGNTVLETGDVMLVLGENSDVEAMRQLVMVSDAAPAGDDSDKEVQT
ncbi:MAG: potassium/proton antiporter [Candidatus Solibacter sp.]|nr:potassium/proton antiporter [Candidatus Solibacter sp.]